MMLSLWRALVIQVSKLLETSDTGSVKSDKTNAFTSLLSVLRHVVSSERLPSDQLLVSNVKYEHCYKQYYFYYTVSQKNRTPITF